MIFWLYFLSFILGISAFFVLGFFLYQNFYKTIRESEEIIVLKKEVANESIDMKKFQSIMEKIETKKTLRIIKKTDNPFD